MSNSSPFSLYNVARSVPTKWTATALSGYAAVKRENADDRIVCVLAVIRIGWDGYAR